MYLVASVRLVCPSTHSRLNRLTYESLPVWGVCLCVCNESAYVDNRADAVDRLLICSIGLGRSGVQLGPVRSPMRNNNMNCTIFTVDMLIYGGEGHKIVPTLFQGPFTKISLNYWRVLGGGKHISQPKYALPLPTSGFDVIGILDLEVLHINNYGFRDWHNQWRNVSIQVYKEAGSWCLAVLQCKRTGDEHCLPKQYMFYTELGLLVSQNLLRVLSVQWTCCLAKCGAGWARIGDTGHMCVHIEDLIVMLIYLHQYWTHDCFHV